VKRARREQTAPEAAYVDPAPAGIEIYSLPRLGLPRAARSGFSSLAQAGDSDWTSKASTRPNTGRIRTDAASAGAILIGAIVACALAGLGVGALIGAPELLAILGGGAGIAAGFWLVYSRFKDL